MKSKYLFTLLISVMILTSCGGATNSTPNSQTSTPSATSTPSTSTTSSSPATSDPSTSMIQLLDFTGVSLSNKTVAFNGEGQTITVVGAPEDSNITYTNAGPHTNVGVYQIGATISKSGYHSLSLEANLTITKIDYVGLSFSDLSIEYDGADHKSDIVVTGIAPSGTVIDYTYKQNNVVVDELIDVGEYQVTAQLSNPNFNDQVLTAVLTIKATEIPQHMTKYQGRLYFSNALDGQMLYSYDGEVVDRVSTDIPLHFVDYGEKKAFISSASFLSSIKSLSPTNEIDTLSSVGAKFMVSDGNTLYYIVNKLTQDNSGIFKMTIGVDGEPIVTRVYIGKATYLEKVSNYLYFADGRNGDRLSRVSITEVETRTAQLVRDEKIKHLTGDGTRLVFTVNNLLGDYLASYTPSSSSFLKLTIDAGKYPQIAGSKVYYSNVDSLTSSVYGKGIYQVPLDGSFSAKSGTKVVDGEDYNLSSLYFDNGTLYYYRVVNKHLYAYDISSKTETDILKDFIAPEYIPISKGGKTVSVGSKVYYTNLYQGKTLYVYDYLTNKNTKLTASKVEDFMIYGDYLYINQVSFFVNNDLFMINLKTGGVPSELSSDDAREMASDGDYLYYVRHNAFGAADAIVRADLASQELVEFFDKGATNLRINDGKLYFLDGGKIYSITLNQITPSSTKMTATQLGTVKNINRFEFDGSDIFYTIRGGGLFNNINELRKSNILNFGEGTLLAGAQTDPLDIALSGDYVYYYSQAESAGAAKFGIYRVSKNASKDGSQVKILTTDNIYYASSLSISNNRLTFISYYLGGLFGDSHVYQIDLLNIANTPTKIDVII